MGKKYQSQNPKITKTRKYANKRNLSASINNIRYLNKKISVPTKKVSNTKINKYNMNDKIGQIIQSLDTLSISSEQKIQNPRAIKLNFPSDLNDQQFIELFIKGIKYCKNKFKINNLINLKIILNKLKEIDNQSGYNNNNWFPFLQSENNLEKIYKKDLLLTLISDENKTDLNLSSKNSIDNVFSVIKEFRIYKDKDLFNNIKEYDNSIQGSISISKFESLLFSSSILNAYKETMEELYDKKVTTSEIKSILKNFRNNHKIYFATMPKGMFGLTLYDGTIILNNFYYNNFPDSTDTFIIFFTLFHEYSHILSRLIRGDNNYFNNTGKFLEKSKKITESGYYFEKKILFNFLKCKSISIMEADYLLNPINYSYISSKDFGKAFNSFKKCNEKEIRKLPRVIIGKNEKNENVQIKIGCYFAGLRNETFLD